MVTRSWLKDKLQYFARHNPVLYHEINRIRRYGSLDDEELEHQAKIKSMQLVRFAARRSRFYKRLYKDVNLSGSFDDVFVNLPGITKSDLRNHSSEISTLPRILLREAYTSGTSGSPLKLYRSGMAIIREHAYVWYFRMLHGLNPGDRIASMRGNLDRNTLYKFNKAENTLYLSSFLLNKEHVGTFYKLLHDFKPVAFCAYPSSALTLANMFYESRLKVCIPFLFTSSETLYPFQRDRLAQLFNSRVIDFYGNAERSIQLAQCEYGIYHEPPMYSYNEYVEKGIITTSLISEAYPIIRYFTDDQVTPFEGKCECGRSKGIRAIRGRVEDMIQLPDGTRVPALNVALKGVEKLMYAQFIQENVFEVQLNLVTAPGFGKEQEAHLIHKVQRLLGTIKININYVTEKDIIKLPGGKFILVISRLKKPADPIPISTF
jgi:phenylacetate-CoA ligase